MGRPNSRDTAMAPERTKLGDIYRERQADLSDAPSNRDTTSDFEMVPHMPRPGRDTASSQCPSTGAAEATDMEVEEPFTAVFDDDEMEIEREDKSINELESFGMTKL